MKMCFMTAKSAWVSPSGDVLPIQPTEEEETEFDEMFFEVLNMVADGISEEEIKKRCFVLPTIKYD